MWRGLKGGRREGPYSLWHSSPSLALWLEREKKGLGKPHVIGIVRIK